MMEYIILVCNENHDVMKKIVDNLTWFEEWFSYFEFQWGKALQRQVDAGQRIGINKSLARNIFKQKQAQDFLCRESIGQSIFCTRKPVK